MPEPTAYLQARWALQRAIQGLAEEPDDPEAGARAEADIARMLEEPCSDTIPTDTPWPR